MNNQPIGIFDSGVGGLTVFAAITESLPSESIVYFGDTGRCPYGVRSARVITEYVRQLMGFLEARDCKLIVVACNSASAVAMDAVADMTAVPVIGVIEPGAREAVSVTHSGRIGVIGTCATIRSGSYSEAIHSRLPGATVITQQCPLFVALAEEDWAGHDVTRVIAAKYFERFENDGIDVLVLGCTHYPILKPDIRAVLDPAMQLVDSATSVAREVERVLTSQGLHCGDSHQPEHRFFVSDSPDRFRRVGERFLKRPVGNVQLVNPATLTHSSELRYSS